MADVYLYIMTELNFISLPLPVPLKYPRHQLQRRLRVHNMVTARHRKRMNQAELARLAKVSCKSISNIETGLTVPNLVLALRIAHILNASVHDLFQLTET
jgi:putative transcriptional regulator